MLLVRDWDARYRVAVSDLRSIQAAVDVLVDETEADVDGLLSKAGLQLTSGGWQTRGRVLRSADLREIISEGSAEAQARLFASLGIDASDHRSSELPADDIRATDGPPGDALSHSTVDTEGPIFVVHGHDHTILHYAVRTLERSTGREVVVLHEQANKGQTILEKFETHATTAAFAVVLLTADDVGGVRDADDARPRGRQNVIFELGFFFGKLGRSRVVVLIGDGVERPSDIEGLVYIALDAAGAWKSALGRELEAADIAVDYSRMP